MKKKGLKKTVLIFVFAVLYNSVFSQDHYYKSTKTIYKQQFNKMLLNNGLSWEGLVEKIREPEYLPILDYIVDTVYINKYFSATEKDMICFYLMGAVTNINRAVPKWKENKIELKKFEDTPHDKMKAVFLDETYKKIKERRHIKDREHLRLLELEGQRLDSVLTVVNQHIIQAKEKLKNSQEKLKNSQEKLKNSQGELKAIEEEIKNIENYIKILEGQNKMIKEQKKKKENR